MICQRALDDGVKLRLNHPHGRQATGQSQALVHGLDGLAQAGRGVTAHGHTHGLGHAHQAMRGLQDGCIESNHGRQEHGVQGAVVQAWVDTAQTVAEGMHTTQPFLKRQRTLHGGAHHLQPGISVLPLLRGVFNVCPTPCQTIQSDAVCWRIEHRGHVSLHAMGDGVHACGSGHQRRQAEGQVGVEDGGFGHQVPGVETQFAAIVDDDDGAARHLAAGASRGGDGNQGQHLRCDATRSTLDGGVGGQGSRVGGGNRHAFGAVDGGPSPQSNDAVTSLRLAQGGGRPDRRLGGVGGGGVKHRAGKTVQGVQCFVQQTSGFDARVGHDQGSMDAIFLAFVAEVFQSARFDVDLREIDETGHGQRAYERCRMRRL